MTTRNELQDEQRRIVDTNTPSLGYVVGEAVVEATVNSNPGLVWRGGVPSFEGTLELQKDLAIRAISEDGDPEAIDVSSVQQTTGFGLSISPKTDSVEVFKRFNYEGSAINFDFPEFDGAGSIKKILVSLQANLTGITRTVIRFGPNSWRINYSEGQPTFGTAESPGISLSSYVSPNSRVIVRHSTVQRARADIQAFEALGNNTPFGRLIETRGWDLDPQSTKDREKGPHDGVVLGVTRDSEDGVALRLTAFGRGMDGRTVFYPQTGGYEPARFVNRTGPIDIPTTPTLIGPSGVDFSVEFYEGTTKRSTDTKALVNTNSLQTLEFNTTSDNIDSIKVVTEVPHRLAWVRHIDLPSPRTFRNAEVDYYRVNRSVAPEDNRTFKLKLYVLGAPIKIPSVASVGGKRPHTYLSYVNSKWNGTSFKEARTRCPIWILYDVLTNPKFGLRIPANRIDVQSFLSASKYCNGLINGRPRFAYDGVLNGTQTQIVDSIFKMIDGYWLNPGPQGLFRVGMERPEQAKWMICKANVENNVLNYRNATRPRPTIRGIFRNRLTGLEETTEGLPNFRVEEVPWGDRDVTNRWIRWQNLREAALLDSIEFTTTWERQNMQIGDLIEVSDDYVVGVRNAGLIIQTGTFGTGRDERTWVQLDKAPLEFWPQQIAGATLVQQDFREKINQELWGYVGVALRAGPILRFQKAGGGISRAIVERVMWNPDGGPEENRIVLSPLLRVSGLGPGTTWVSPGQGNISPTTWRVQSIKESGGDNRKFEVVATRQLVGMHRFIETGVAIPEVTFRFDNVKGSSLSHFRGNWSLLTDTYPLPESIPFGPPGTFTQITPPV